MLSYRELFQESMYKPYDQDDEPSYEDIVILRKLRDPDVKIDEDDEISEEEYNTYSEEEKQLKHKARKLMEQLVKTKEDDIDVAKLPDLATAKVASITEEDEEVYLVHYYEKVFKWGEKPDSKKHFMDSRSEELFNQWMPGTFTIHNCDVEVLPDLEQAKMYIFKRMKDLEKKTSVTPADFKVYGGNDIPESIKKFDSKAIALKYEVFEGTKGVADDFDMRGEQAYYKHGDQVKTPNEWAKELNIQPQRFRKYIKTGQLSDYKRVNKDGSDYEVDMEWKTITKDERYSYWILRVKKSMISTVEYGQLLEAIETADIGISNEAVALIVQAIEDSGMSWSERGDRTREQQELKRKEREKFRSLNKSIKDTNDEIKDLHQKKEEPTKDDDDEDDLFDFQDLSDDDIEAAADSEHKRKSRDDMDDDEFSQAEYGDDYEDRQRKASDYYDQSDDRDNDDNDEYIPSWER